MVTKLKNKWILLVWILLLAHGISGLFTGLFYGSNYIGKNYFETPQFEGQLDNFIQTLSQLELNYIPKEEAKKLITVTDQEINEHRYRYGDLSQQVSNIKNQYEGKIQRAIVEKNDPIVDSYKAERDKKIEDITKNFQSDEYVRAKIVKEKEQKVDDYYRDIEIQRPDLIKYKNVFKYYLKDTVSNQTLTNMITSDSTSKEELTADNTLFIRTYPSSKYGPISTQGSSPELDRLVNQKTKIFMGQIAVPSSALAQGSILHGYYDFQAQQKKFYLHTITGIVALIASLYLLKKIPIIQIVTLARWRPYYLLVPIDVRMGLFACTTVITLILVGQDYTYRYDQISEWLFYLLMSALFVSLTFLQGLNFLTSFQEKTVKSELLKSLTYRTLKGINNSFLIRSICVQVLILLSAVFLLGCGFGVAMMNPRIIPIYVVGLLLLGIPVLVFCIKRSGYFNQIVLHSTQLACGILEPDLPIKGKSAFASLAHNINQLKHGVKASQKEQAKSERLKTELITNVSHDLRTPLTSIISYTDLLRTPNLSSEERDAYIEIIDRKSKRLKVLIDDLFEASKMASGSINFIKEQVDLKQLLQQALAEHDKEIKQSTLQLRVTAPVAPVLAFVDGQKLWRVFDNLIMNILKYSLENTRVYISIEQTEKQAVIMFKNVTKYELGGSIDELFERFKRGDASRHTEGSGLGLAIAKSIVDLHGGSLDIDIDGDLFKVTLIIK